MKKSFHKVISFGLAALLLVACGGGKEGASSTMDASDNAGASDSASVVESGDGKTVVVATSYEASSLDPVAQNEVAATNAMVQIFEGLLIVEEDGSFTPVLAESWDVENNQKFTFHLRSGVKFHNGEPFTAADVEFSLRRAAEAPAVSSYFGDINLDSFNCPDDLTISFELNHPNSAFLSYLTHSGALITNKKAVEEAGDRVGVEPVGTGPLKLESWSQNDKMVLVRNDDYWGKKVAFERMELKPIVEQPNRAVEIETGNADIAYDLAGLDVERLKDNKDVVLYPKQQNNITYLGFNLKNEILSKLPVRQAIQAAIDVDAMVESVGKGIGKSASGYVASVMKYSVAAEHPNAKPDLEKAKALLKDAGYPDGFSIRLMTNENPARIAYATIIKEELSKIGIQVEISNLEWTTFLENIKNPDNYDMYLLGWSSTINDPDVGLYPLLHSSASATGSNYAHFENEEFDALMDQGRLLEDGPEREEVYKKAQEVLYRELPFIPVAESEYVSAARSNIEGFEQLSIAYNRLYPVVKK
uniref:ABC transporter substrate-binding protein n=1 Tax=Ndongobacter massiliensis TaxID=1871025 RepID=UPI00092FF72B|nr:ABC transporter substrate-binding protein [Ndongobacter massiliensis]